MRKIDVSKWTDKRDGAEYLNWAKVVDVLHKNGELLAMQSISILKPFIKFTPVLSQIRFIERGLLQICHL